MKEILLLFCLLPLSLGREVLGVDVSSLIDNFTCVKNSGYSLVIVRGYQSFGTVDPNAVQTIQSAQAAGIASIDVYMTPCVPCGNPGAQVQELLNALGTYTNGRTVWLDIEQFQWSANTNANQVFIQNLVGNFTSVKQDVGIYTTSKDWNAIVGQGWKDMASLPLWYSDCDNNKDFKDFLPFSGWEAATMKQYNCGQILCGYYVALDYQDT